MYEAVHYCRGVAQ